MSRFTLPTILLGVVAALAACTATGTAVVGPTPLPVPIADGSCAPSAGPVTGCLITPAPGASAAPTTNPGAGLAAQPLTGLQIPDLPYMDVDSKRYQLAALKGRPLLVTAWAHWCSHCQHELPLIQNWVKANAAKGLVWVPVEGSKATPQQVKEFATKYAIDQPLYLDPLGGIVGAIKASGYPTDVFVDATFTARGGSTGAFDAPAYDSLLAQYPKL